MTSTDFKTLLDQAAKGDADAMTNLIERYEPQIRIVVRSRLGVPLQAFLDSMDVVQSVHRSLITGLQRGQYEIASGEKLIALAATIVRRKIARHWRKAKRELPALCEQELVAPAADSDPVAEVAAKDEIERVLARVSSADRQILELRLAGYNTKEAAQKLGLSPGVVRVRLGRLRERLKLNLPIAPS